ncbi:HlyD family efflux transporter periplasmic adaptor subunit [Olivibacter sp. CPCC 100613]|uniref:HlyD family secretion protein n=1 Tax=Olivibacter sp. CPCC 100613 TaxID=3079931 RepID=UPI002FF9B3E5
MPENNQLNTEAFSSHVQEIITDVPNWLVRWGISLFFAIILLFLIFSAIISMPSVINGHVVIDNESPPEEIIVGSSGKLTKLFVNENSRVDSGAILGYIQSTAYHQDVLTLAENIEFIRQFVTSNRYDKLSTIGFNNFRHLGELQDSFHEFMQEFVEFNAYLTDGLFERKKQYVNFEIVNIISQNKYYNNQLNLQKNNYQLSQKDFDAYKILYEKKVISEQEYREAESKLINSRMPLQNIQASIIANNTLLSQKQSELIEIENRVRERKATFLSIVNRFKSEIEKWKREFILISNTKGKVVFNRRLYIGQWIEANTPIFVVESTNDSNFVGRLQIGQYAFGKIKEGQTVLLKVDAYPYQEFGILKGKIVYLPDVAYTDSLYNIKVQLNENGKTTYNRNLQLRSGLSARAEVITEKRSLLSKLLDNFYSIFRNRA